MNIIGFSSFYHDSAACLVQNGEIKHSVQEERFSRVKHDASFPEQSIRYCLSKLDIKDLDHIVFYEKPFLKFERILETCFAFAPMGFNMFRRSMPLWVSDKIFLKNKILKMLININKNIDWDSKLLFSDHHLSHQSSAFYPSPFENAAILTMDGVGEWNSTSIAIGNGNKIEKLKFINFPHSLGLLYSAFTHYLGFKVNSGEYKVMGLAPYGDPKYTGIIKDNIISIQDDGSFYMNMNFFDYCTDLKMTSKKFHNLFGGKPRTPNEQISQKDMDIAASLQSVTNEIVIKISKNIYKETGLENLCLAGGVALNCVTNGKIIEEKIFKKVWVQPASGDAGGAIGAALAVHYMKYEKKRNINTLSDSMKGSYLGPSYSNSEIENTLSSLDAVYEKLDDDEIINKTAIELSKEKVVGWMQGKMEFGPRSLGNRSILADPRASGMQKKLNMKIKFRESFRPFAPSILHDHVSKWFEIKQDSPYMLFVSKILEQRRKKISTDESKLFGIDKLNLKRCDVPSITHVDYSARLQTVEKKTNIKYYNLIKKFYDITNVPMLINTSFNVRGEPIVCNVEDAFKCFMGTDLDILVIGNYILYKEQQNQELKKSYLGKYKLD